MHRRERKRFDLLGVLTSSFAPTALVKSMRKCGMRSVMQGERPEFTGDPFNNQRGEMTPSGGGVASNRLHRPVEVASMERVD